MRFGRWSCGSGAFLNSLRQNQSRDREGADILVRRQNSMSAPSRSRL